MLQYHEYKSPTLQSVTDNDKGLRLGLDGKSSFAQQMSLVGAPCRQSRGVEGNSAAARVLVAALRAAGVFPVDGQGVEGYFLLAAERVVVILPIGQEINMSLALLL